MSGFSDWLSGRLEEIESAGLARKLRVLDSAQGVEVECEGARLVNFSSNDYLGLAADPRLHDAASACGGWGAGASRLISGNHRDHEQLESTLAAFKRTEAALSFSTGYAAALGAIPALAGEGDVIILDKLCHACLVDGARLSGATLRVFPHNHLEKLESHLRWARERHPDARILVLAESIYSMDGDRAPLAGIVELKDRHGAWLMLDEAHGVGVAGDHGRGLADELALTGRIEIQMGTLGKALGASGAYLCGSEKLRAFLINKARSFVFSTAPPPPCAAAATAAVKILESDEGAELQEQLWDRIDLMGRGLGKELTSSAIVPLILGTEEKAMSAADTLKELGFWVPAIRFPTVTKGAARLRICLSAKHTDDHIVRLGAALSKLQ